MMVNTVKVLLFVLLFHCMQTTYGQEMWRNGGSLIDNKSNQIAVDYLLSQNSCNDLIQPSRFRYRILRLSNKKEGFIYWKFDFVNCNNELVSKEVKLPLSSINHTGILEDPSFTFQGIRVVKEAYAILETNFQIIRQSATPVSALSIEPLRIQGDASVDRGSAVTLTLIGGYLSPGAKWKWYQGFCSGLFVDTGRSISVRPGQNTTFFVRAEGKNITNCVAFPIQIVNKNVAATNIIGRNSMCEGEKNIRLSVIGGRLGDGGRWVWYAGDCSGTPVGEGSSIMVSPSTTTTYYVRAEGATNITECKRHELIVNALVKSPTSISGLNSVNMGAPVVLSVQGGQLAGNARWVWYTDTANVNNPAGVGNTITIYPTNSVTYYVRGEDSCGNTSFLQTSVRVKSVKYASSTLTSTKYPFFINGGVVSDNPGQLHTINNYVATVGGGRNIGWFLRAKWSGEQPAAPFETIDGGNIVNYLTSGYYRYNGKTIAKRSGYTAGVYVGGENIAFYIGGGYGTRQLLFGIDQYSYNNNFLLGSNWTSNAANTYKGLEGDAGLIIKAGFINLMGGLSSIQGKYNDFNLGLGLNF